MSDTESRTFNATLIRALELPDSSFNIRKVRGRWIAEYAVRMPADPRRPAGHRPWLRIRPPSQRTANDALNAVITGIARECASGGQLAAHLP